MPAAEGRGLYRLGAAGAGACERAAQDVRHRGRDARAGGGDSRRACGLMAIERLAVVGLGLIGSSIARAAKAKLPHLAVTGHDARSEEHTSELQSLMRISYAVFCL